MDALARPPVQHHGVARLDRGHARADLDHLRRRLVAEQVRQELVGALGGGDLVELGAADRRVEHLDQDLADAERLRQRDLVDDKRLARLREDRRLRCLDLHRYCPIRNR